MKTALPRSWARDIGALALVVGIAGCASKTPTTRVEQPATTTTITPTTTSTAPPPTLPPLHLTSALASATHLLDAWKANDRLSAAQAATSAAVGSLFAQPYQAPQGRGCDGGQPESDCFYRYGASGGLRLHVTRQGDGSWVVTEASLAG